MARYKDVVQIGIFTAADGTVAATAARLVNFTKGQAGLIPDHPNWLRDVAVPAILERPNAWVDLYGFASKIGAAQKNLELSQARAAAVKNFLAQELQRRGGALDGKVNIDHGFGEFAPDYIAAETDDSPYYRAVQVTVYGSKPAIIRPPQIRVPPPTPNGHLSGKALATRDAPLARGKVQQALAALVLFRDVLADRRPATPIDQVAVDALRAHFRLSLPGSAAAPPARPMTLKDIDFIQSTFTRIDGVLRGNATTFRDGNPVNGPHIPAEAPFGGPITFGPAFRNFDAPDGARIGPNSRAAILIHEATHVVDNQSGAADVHISEFNNAYDTQPADKALRNPSSYASFAAHIHNGSDPPRRFGLGPGRFE